MKQNKKRKDNIKEKNYFRKNIGMVLIIISIITFLILSTILVMEIKYMKDIEKEDRVLITFFDENQNDKEKLEKYSIKAILKIPKVNVKELIYNHENDLYEDLEKGIIVYNIYDELSHGKTNMSVILGHNSGLRTKKVFLELEKLLIGDKFTIEFEEEESEYLIKQRHIVDPTSDGPFLKEDDKNKVYLFTCYPYPLNHKRLILEGHKIEE